MDESLITVTTNENPTIELGITAYNNNVDIKFVQSIESTISVHNTDENAHENIIMELQNKDTELSAQISTKANSSDVPTKVSQLTNDSNFATVAQLPIIPVNISSFTNDKGYVTSTQMTTSLAAKADTALSNITSAGKTAIFNATIINTWTSTDGKSFYRKWSDGWIEQGGILSSMSNGCTITFPLAFTSTYYKIVGNTANLSTSYTEGCVDFYNRALTTCQMWWTAYTGTTLNYYACGY